MHFLKKIENKIETKLEFEKFTKTKWLIVAFLVTNFVCFYMLLDVNANKFFPPLTTWKTIILIAYIIYDLYFIIQMVQKKQGNPMFTTINGYTFYFNYILYIFLSLTFPMTIIALLLLIIVCATNK